MEVKVVGSFKVLFLTILYISKLLDVCFCDTSSIRKFDKLIINNILVGDKYIYLGGVNEILSLKYDKHFTTFRTHSTGPHEDNPMCIMSDRYKVVCGPIGEGLKLLDDYNKILLMAKTPTPMLIVCGTIYRGICEFLDPETLTQLDIIHKGPVVSRRIFIPDSYASSNLPDASTTAFLKNDKSNETTVLVTGRTMTYMHHSADQGVITMLLLGKSLEDLDLTFLPTKEDSSLIYDRKHVEGEVDGKLELTATFKVDFVSSFLIGEFGYFLFNQKKSFRINMPYISKISRVSVLETSLEDYVEIELSCKSNNVDYNLLVSASVVEKDGGDPVFFGVFGKTTGTTKQLAGEYAVCRFLLKEADTRISNALENCDQTMAFVDWSTKEARGCRSNTKQKMLAPNIVLEGEVLHETKQETSSILGFPHKRGISLYLANKGLKITMFDVKKESLFQFNQETFGEQSESGLFNKIILGNTKEYIYTVSNNSIAKFLIEDCQNRKSCERCLSGPGCGWCTLQNKCSIREECTDNERDNYYINGSSEMCPSISNVSPKNASVKESREVTFELVNVPTDVNYKCSFNGYSVDGSLEGTLFTCNKIALSLIPKNASVLGLSSVAVSLLSNKEFVASAEFTLYDCSSLNMCKSCISGVNNCGWCSETLTCIDGSTSTCTSSLIPYQSENSEKHKDLCPRVVSILDKYLPSNVKREIKLIGTELPQDDGGNKYVCILLIEGKKQTTPAKWKSATELTCDTKKFLFDASNSSYIADISVTYGKAQIDTSNLQAHLFKCDVQRKDCSICMVAPAAWQCRWCEISQTCSVNEKCTGGSITNKCPRPVIRSVIPTEVALGGGTNVTIEGKDLGMKASEITSITLAGVPCKHITELYRISRRVVCVTEKQNNQRDGIVEVKVSATGGNFTSTYQTQFYYRDPRITRFQPTKGPCSGGTTVTIDGIYLDVGNTVKVFIGRIRCRILLKSRTNITCKTERNDECDVKKTKRKRRAAKVLGLRVEFDGYVVEPRNKATFDYMQDPLITNLYTYKESVRAETFQSGGQVILVEGHTLLYIQNAIMIFTSGKQEIGKTLCSIKSMSKMECIAPNISAFARTKGDKFTVNVGFQLDGVDRFTTYRNVTIVPDPVFDPFSDGINEVKTNDLILTGSGFDVISKGDVIITVAGLPCNVTDMDKRLVCKLPSETDVLENSQKHPGGASVEVKVGRGNLTYILGNIKFYKADNDNTSWIVYVVPGIAGLLILVIIIVILCVLYRRKHKKDKEYHELVQMRMDRMESQYAREAKEAFAEYQTEITDLTHDVDLNVAPYLDFPHYAMRVLYPGVADHPILEENRDSRPEWEESMMSLVNLLKEENFVLTFIRTLESQTSFQMTDRCIVASLLMVSLQDNVRYVTLILKELLTDLIHKTATGKRPKLLLRRTESVAEKLLTNWLAYTLHGFLENTVGEPLFKLFSAINILLEKEPIDAVTSDAKNSLSEDKLLRQKIDFTSMTLNVEYVTDQETEKFENIQVVSCDTISQTKRKILKFIYKDKPFSFWPKVDELILGFPTTSGAVLILKDEDGTNILEGEWKKINTLEHYRVPDKANLRLGTPAIMNTNDALNDTVLNNVSMASVGFQPGISSTSTPMLHHADLNEPKLYHMVKQQEYNQEQKEDSRQNKMMAEIFLTRLLKTKETLQLFVNKLFDSIFGLYEGGRTIPPSVKYMFDFLDSQAAVLEIDGEEVRHTWKNNSLPLRFWINMIKNPNFIFDIDKSNTVDSCLSVIAQLFMDSCSPDEHRLGKHSPSNKLLYAKEIPEYKKKVKKFYADVAEYKLDEEEFFQSLDKISEKYGKSFNSCNAARELMSYAVRYKVKVMDTLEQNGFEEYAERLQTIMENMPDD